MPYDKEELKKFVDTGQVQIFRFVHGNNSLATHIVSIGHVEDYPIMHYFAIPGTMLSIILIHDFIWNFWEFLFKITVCLVHRFVIKREKLELPVNHQIKIYSGTGHSKVWLYMIFIWQYGLAVCSIDNFMNTEWMLYPVCLWQFKLEIYPVVHRRCIKQNFELFFIPLLSYILEVVPPTFRRG